MCLFDIVVVPVCLSVLGVLGAALCAHDSGTISKNYFRATDLSQNNHRRRNDVLVTDSLYARCIRNFSTFKAKHDDIKIRCR